MKFFGGKKQEDTMPTRRRRQAVDRPEATPVPPSFRRNRTMTDRSTLPEVSERARVHQLRLLRRKVGTVLAVTVAGLIVVVIGMSQFTHSVRIVGSDTATVQQLDTASYQHYFDEYYKQHPFERFRFATNYDQLSQWLQVSAPEIASVVPRGIDALGVAKYEVRVRAPLVSWRVGDEQYFVDAGGVTFKKNYFAQPTVAVIDESGAQVQQGTAIASGRLLSFVGRAVALANDNGFTITQVEIPSQSMRQVYLRGEAMPTVRMTIDRGVEYQVADMQRGLAFFAANNEAPEYLDVRTPGKVFYR